MSLNMHFIKGNQMNIKALEVDIKHGYSFQWYAYSWNFESGG